MFVPIAVSLLMNKTNEILLLLKGNFLKDTFRCTITGTMWASMLTRD